MSLKEVLLTTVAIGLGDVLGIVIAFEHRRCRRVVRQIFDDIRARDSRTIKFNGDGSENR